MEFSPLKTVLCLTVFIILVVPYAFFVNLCIAETHPVEVSSQPICADCHVDERGALSHTSDFFIKHKFHAYQNKQWCQACHRESFCSDCHANKDELKPSDKYRDMPERYLPHRGDYISQHKIDGKINPAPCMKCHGRKNNWRCKACHR